jgi:hypothetical protein
MKHFLILLLSILVWDVSGQTIKSTSYRYVHNCAPLIAAPQTASRYSYFINRSPYKNIYGYTTTASFLTPPGYKDNKELCSYIIEFETTDISPVMNNDGTVKMSVMLMYYTYNVNVKIYDRDGNVIKERNLTLCDRNNTIFIEQPTEALSVYDGNRYAADEYIRENLSEIYKTSLADAKEYIEYSFNGKRDVDTFYVFSAKAPKQGYDYKEMDNAVTLFKNTMLAHNTKKEDTARTKANLQKCINVWEKELNSANYKDNGARINTAIAMSLHYNLAMAYFVLGDYPLAYEHIHKTYKKEVDQHQQLRSFTDFEKQSMDLEKTIMLCWDK